MTVRAMTLRCAILAVTAALAPHHHDNGRTARRLITAETSPAKAQSAAADSDRRGALNRFAAGATAVIAPRAYAKTPPTLQGHQARTQRVAQVLLPFIIFLRARWRPSSSGR